MPLKIKNRFVVKQSIKANPIPPMVVNYLRATGGVMSFSGSYVIHTFTSSATLNVANPGNADLLIVGGGGGGEDLEYSSYTSQCTRTL